MTRNLKALGLALVAVLALSAVAASAASADTTDFNAPEAVEIDMIADGTQFFTIPTLPKNPFTCTEVSGSAAYSGETSELTGENAAVSTCHVVIAGITLPITIDMNGCHLLFTGGTFDTETGVGTGSVHIKECGATKSITITLFANKTKHANNEPQCTYHIPEQTINGIVYHNATTEGVMAITAEAPGLAVKTLITNNGATGCTKEEEVNATYNGSFYAKGTNAEELYVDTTVEGTPTGP